ncbi:MULTISPECIES: pyridoxal phosphate-dependent aminotransferase [unclassified Roseateles]|uniref:pyridoxal phosphate-dependent aminotransferase n=1 Tax=unclassified Roseateles TaxID=2626991 RepID=UPI0006FF6E02|nr:MULTISPECIES: pyridoxal phosphate-dependent aminotransferase [unclassified Roseateles]KQW43584.1 aminotransferase [Pelomonas sp. Root405]KRA71322.1 aminotransferase [Pelomonas sp. Root662]
MKLASRLDRIEPFYVMELAKAAAHMAAGPLCDPAQGGRRMIRLNVGEPDFGAAPAVREAVARVAQDPTPYTDALGQPALREAISRWYAQRFGLAIAADRIAITAGASAGLQLACLALFERGDEVLMPDPCYPCNRHFVTAADATPRLLPTGAAERFQLGASQVRAAWTPATRGVLLASPSNPTGTSIAPEVLADIAGFVRGQGGVTVVDEIYLPLSYEEHFGHSALALGDDIVSVNSFSKYFGMTGWRLGWLVLPPALVPAVERLAQNLYICPSTLAQMAALAAFEPASIAEFERRRAVLRERRNYIVAALNDLGLTVPVPPDGAFYAWMDISRHHADSWTFAHELLQRAQVALTPGRDFGLAAPQRWMRLSFASSMEDLQEAVARLREVLA